MSYIYSVNGKKKPHRRPNTVQMAICLAVIILLGVSAVITYENTCSAGTIISTGRYYSSEYGCYIQITTEIYTEYDAQMACNVNKRRITTRLYADDTDESYIDERVTEEILSYAPIATAPAPTYAVPTYAPTITPYITSEPSATPAPAVTSTPSPTDVPGPMKSSAPKLAAVRTMAEKISITWDAVNNASGYIIYRSTNELSGYIKIKTIKSGSTTQYNNKGLRGNKVYYYKIKAYQDNGEKTVYSKLSKPVQVQTPAVVHIVEKLEQLKLKYPDGRYWNHIGYYVSSGQSVEGFVTRTPCVHDKTITIGNKKLSKMGSRCNYYIYRLNGKKILGYQCDGYAAMLSDKLFGKSGFKTHKSYSRADVGDCVRFKGHTALITEKHANYIIVTECNVGNTCVISWGRKIKKSKLKDAVYYTK